jgi:hypothetical protein
MTSVSSRRSWTLALLGALPQILLAVVLFVQGRNRSGHDAGTQSQLGLLAAAVFLFWSLAGCGVLALWARTRPAAGALACGSIGGFGLTVIVAFAA